MHGGPNIGTRQVEFDPSPASFGGRAGASMLVTMFQRSSHQSGCVGRSSASSPHSPPPRTPSSRPQPPQRTSSAAPILMQSRLDAGAHSDGTSRPRLRRNSADNVRLPETAVCFPDPCQELCILGWSVSVPHSLIRGPLCQDWGSPEDASIGHLNTADSCPQPTWPKSSWHRCRSPSRRPWALRHDGWQQQ